MSEWQPIETAPKVKRFARNKAGRDFIVGDLHGCYREFYAILAWLGFNEVSDRVFSVGDLVDRGPDSADVLSLLKKEWFHAVRGNHENLTILGNGNGTDHQMYVHIMNGGEWFYRLTDGERVEIVSALDALPYAIQLETVEGLVGIVHAECPLQSWEEFCNQLEASDRVRKAATWNRDRVQQDATPSVDGVRAVVCGHTPLDAPKWSGNHLWIDTAGWHRSGRFTILDAETLKRA